MTFSNMDLLESITIPADVTYIGNYAFLYNTALTSIHSNTVTPIDVSAAVDVFYNISTSLCTIYVPTGSTAAYQAASKWSTFSNIVEDVATNTKNILKNKVIINFPS
jgi:hypothetical protein